MEIYHAAIPTNSAILSILDPTIGKLRIGYIKGHYSEGMSNQASGMDTIQTIRKRVIEWGTKSTQKHPQPISYNDTKELQEFFDKYDDFTIDTLDIYWEYIEQGITHIVVLPFRKWSFKPSFSTKIFGEIPSNDLREKIKKRMNQLDKQGRLNPKIKKRLRDTWLVNTVPIGVRGDKLDIKFYQWLLGRNIMGLTVHKETSRAFTGRELK